MHKQAQLCSLANGTECDGKTNEDLEIELGSGFICFQKNPGTLCCNQNWCYDNNGADRGSVCADSSNLSPVAIRVDEIPSDVNDLGEGKYQLEMEFCKEGTKKIVCTGSGKWCKIFGGEGRPIN